MEEMSPEEYAIAVETLFRGNLGRMTVAEQEGYTAARENHGLDADGRDLLDHTVALLLDRMSGGRGHGVDMRV